MFLFLSITFQPFVVWWKFWYRWKDIQMRLYFPLISLKFVQESEEKQLSHSTFHVLHPKYASKKVWMNTSWRVLIWCFKITENLGPTLKCLRSAIKTIIKWARGLGSSLLETSKCNWNEFRPKEILLLDSQVYDSN